MKRNLLLAAAGALALGAAGMSAAAAEDITVGVIANLTGQDINTSVQMARGVELVARAREEGVDVTCETCAHYLVLTADDAIEKGALAKCAPPLRSPTSWQSNRA